MCHDYCDMYIHSESSPVCTVVRPVVIKSFYEVYHIEDSKSSSMTTIHNSLSQLNDPLNMIYVVGSI